LNYPSADEQFAPRHPGCLSPFSPQSAEKAGKARLLCTHNATNAFSLDSYCGVEVTDMTRDSLQRWAAIALLVTGLAASSPATPSKSDDTRSQDRITREVRHELVMIPQLTIFDNLAYKVNGDTVTLLGQVRNAVIKDSAARSVKRIEGVEQVVNNIEVLPPSPNDDRIRLAVARAIFNDSRLFRYSMGAVPPIHIIVKNGHVALEGVVDNQVDKDTANIRANGVPGVFSVQNNLRVEK
jgi:hyperosmotically inducible protein